LIDIYGSPLWKRLSEAERVELNRRVAAWRLSALMHGEQGALLACSQLVDIVQDADAKFFQATQVVDEARHNEVLDRYMTGRLGFGRVARPEVVNGAAPAERGDVEHSTCFAVEKTLTGFFPLEAYEDAGFSRAQIEEAKRYRRDVAARNDYAPFRKVFKRDMHAAMVGNLARLGLLTERVRPRLEKLGVTLPTS